MVEEFDNDPSLLDVSSAQNGSDIEYSGSPSALAALAAKVARLQLSDIAVARTKRNNYGTDYPTMDDTMTCLRRRIAEEDLNLAVFISTPRQWQLGSAQELGTHANNGPMTAVAVRVTFVCGDTGGMFSVTGQGQGADKGGLAAAKAATSACRTLILKNLLCSDDDDFVSDSGSQRSGNNLNAGRGSSSGNGGGAQDGRGPRQLTTALPDNVLRSAGYLRFQKAVGEKGFAWAVISDLGRFEHAAGQLYSAQIKASKMTGDEWNSAATDVEDGRLVW